MAQRTVLSALIAGFMIGGPVYRQLLGGESRMIRQWTMFGDIAVEVCRARYFRRTGSGPDVPVDRLETLGYPSQSAAPKHLVHIHSLEGAERVGWKLCENLEPGTDLRLDLDCATRDGWRSRARRERNLCAPEGAPSGRGAPV